MIKVEKSSIIRRPIEEVFAYVSDLRHSVEWQSGVVEVRKTTEGPLGVGTQFVFVRKFMGRKMEGSSEFVEYEPNTKVTFRPISGPASGESSYLFESTPEGTRVTAKVEMQFGGFFGGLAESLIAASLRPEVEAGAGELKDLLENRTVKITS
jgi:carbon monoxide dehydrogenase subunit G